MGYFDCTVTVQTVNNVYLQSGSGASDRPELAIEKPAIWLETVHRKEKAGTGV